MSQDIHEHAERLLLKSSVEGLAPAEETWLGLHLRDCTACVAVAGRLEEVVHSLRSATVDVEPSLVERTRRKVRLRAGELGSGNPAKTLIWIACAVTWAWMAVSAPYVWRGFAWVGSRTGFPDWTWQMGFGLWWLLPALAVGAALMAHKSTVVIFDNGFVQTQMDRL